MSVFSRNENEYSCTETRLRLIHILTKAKMTSLSGASGGFFKNNFNVVCTLHIVKVREKSAIVFALVYCK